MISFLLFPPATQEGLGHVPKFADWRGVGRHGRTREGNRQTHLARRSGVVVVLSQRFPVGTAQPHELFDDLVEPLALDELHGVKGDLGLLPDLEDRHDVRVVQPRSRLRLATETFQGFDIARHVPGQDLQSNSAAQRDLLGLVYYPHAAMTDFAHDPIIAQLVQSRDGRVRLPERVIPGGSLDLFDLDQGREHLADFIGHFRQTVDIFFQSRALAPAIPLGKLLGQLVKTIIVMSI
jgi:hypothetical protein